MKILIFGIPGSGKATLAEPLAKLLGGVHITSRDVRQKYEGHDTDKWDYTPEGREKLADRMRHIADGIVLAGQIAVADFVCPTQKARQEFGADFTVFMDTVDYSTFDGTFEKPERHDVDYHVAKWFEDTHVQLVPVVERFMKKQNTTPIGYVAWRLENEDK